MKDTNCPHLAGGLRVTTGEAAEGIFCKLCGVIDAPHRQRPLSSALPSEVRPGSENDSRDPFQGAFQVEQRLAAGLFSVGRAVRTRADADTLPPPENL